MTAASHPLQHAASKSEEGREAQEDLGGHKRSWDRSDKGPNWKVVESKDDFGGM